MMSCKKIKQLQDAATQIPPQEPEEIEYPLYRVLAVLVTSDWIPIEEQRRKPPPNTTPPFD